MRKPFWTSSMLVLIVLLVVASCAPTQENGVGLPRDQSPIQAALTATTFTPTVPSLPIDTSTPTSTLIATLPYTATPTLDEQAVILAKALAPQFSQIFGVQFNPSFARGLDAAKLGGPAGQLAGTITPVIDGNQQYTDRDFEIRQVEGILSLNDNRLDLEAMIIINKGTIQYLPVPLGAYMVACHPDRPNDCLAVSLQGEEFQVKPESVSIISVTPPPLGTPPPTATVTLTGTPCPSGMFCPTGTPPPAATATLAGPPCPTCFPSSPSADFEEGSIHTCFSVFEHKICIKIF